ncbi:rod-determining factor RdfA [Halobacterium zhouii]|uniref:rod-determining factor RdfA n=1 Tax=Halobacterium zhouii TaxID=2902624 RepID=UPI001E4E2C9C|nr:rod-determining factor RdfA [Halobacterium zhouii]
MTDADTPDETRCKVGRLIVTYDLQEMGAHLERRWTGAGEERASLRTLADEFNRQLLRVALANAGHNPVEQDVTTTYEVLTDDDVSEGARTQKRLELSRDGVDVDSLLGDFVSHQAVHTYLRRYRGAERESDAADQIESDVETLRRLQARTGSVTADAVERSASTERIDVGEFDVLVNVRVLCQDCGADYEAVELLERGGCDCESDRRSTQS